MMVDSNGTVLAGDRQTANWIGKSVEDTPLFREIGYTAEGTARVEGLDGVRRIYGFVHVPASDARLVVGLPEADVLRRSTARSRSPT